MTEDQANELLDICVAQSEQRFGKASEDDVERIAEELVFRLRDQGFVFRYDRDRQTLVA